jgi:hypothetical protein
VPVAERRLDLLAQMAHAQHDVAEALAPEQFQLMREEWFPHHGHKRLGNRVGDRAQPRRQAAPEYRHAGKGPVHG